MSKKILEIFEKFGYEIAEECGNFCIFEITVSPRTFRQLDESIKSLAAYTEPQFKYPTTFINLAMPFGYVIVKEKKDSL